MEMEAELSRIIINEMSDQQVIVLKERHGERSFPIVIGIVEIFAIDRRLKGIKPVRPMTHDLISNIFIGMGVSLQRVIINDVRDRTFFARIILKMDNELGSKICEIDSRPSDAIALALHDERPIYVSNKVLEAEEDMTELLERILKEQG